MSFVVATFYKFVHLSDCADLRPTLLSYCKTQDVKGTILLASEGINGTIVGSHAAIEAVLSFLKSDPRLADLEHKEANVAEFPFERLKVKVKEEIVTFGKPEVNPAETTGVYVTPQEWSKLIADPDVVVIDTRNGYEVDIGSFQGAINPQTESFSEFPNYVEQYLHPDTHKKVAMFCTGGIRCEKASAYLLSQGFAEVYHLRGGILKYLEEIPVEESLWQGECFVFDERVAVTHGLQPGTHEMCRGCGYPVSIQDKTSPHYKAGVCCPHCFGEETDSPPD